MNDKKRITVWLGDKGLNWLRKQKGRIPDTKIISRRKKGKIEYALFYLNGHYESNVVGHAYWVDE